MTIVEVSKEVLNQLRDVTKSLESNHYSEPIETLSGASIGQHIRHTLEFFLCLKSGAENGSVNYDNRSRDVLLETSQDYVLKSIEEIEQFLDYAPIGLPLTMEVNYALSSDNTQQVRSNLDRELCYNVEHAVHHMALIKIGVRTIAPYIDLPRSFGVAVSTLRHENNLQKA